jgi:hypothetical protein
MWLSIPGDRAKIARARASSSCANAAEASIKVLSKM